MRREDILNRKEEILQWISENKSKAFICRELKCKPETLNSYLEKMGIHYAGNQSHKGEKMNTSYKKAEDYIKNENVKSHILKQKLIREGLKEEKCEICGVSEWQGVKLPLELHHKDCDHFNNNFNNLMILCPNCHSIQEGNSGANVGKYSKNCCIDCGIEISKNSKRCKSCASKEENKPQQKVQRPSREELKDLIRNKPFIQIGKMFGVSDNAIRKWCDAYNLPRKVSDIKNYTDEEWFKL